MKTQGSLTDMQLRITHVYGRAVDIVLPWPANKNVVDLALLLEGAGIEFDDVHEVKKCRFHGVAQHATGLGFEHGCTELLCGLNTRRLPKNVLSWLQDGDALQIGLMQLRVERVGRADSAPAVQLKGVDFDLRQLAPEGVAEVAPHSIEGWLQMNEEQAAEPIKTEHVDPLAMWNDHYLNRLRSPHSPLDDANWGVVQNHTQLTAHDPMGDLMVQARRGPELTEILGQSDHISTVLAHLDDASPNPLTVDPMQDDLMQLFAPPDFKRAEQGGHLPKLTRLEHHGVSLDSAIQ